MSDSTARFLDLLDAAGDWGWEIDLEQRYTYASPEVFKLLGYCPEEVLGRFITSRGHLPGIEVSIET